MEKVVVLQNKSIDSYIQYGIHYFILGLEHYSVSYSVVYSLEKIKEILINYPDIQLFVAMNRTFYDEELEQVKDVLNELSLLKIKGVLFYDLAILELKKELNLSLDLVWNQTHMVTNKNTCQFYYNKGVKYGYLSNEITLEEMIEIKKNSNIKCMVLVLGYPIMAHSKRKLLNNYFTFMGNKASKKRLEIKNSGDYLVTEEQYGTTIRSHTLLLDFEAFLTLEENEFDYAIFDESEMDHELFLSLLEVYTKLQNKTFCLEEAKSWQEKSVPNIWSGFFYKKTIYQVKKDEK